jgi:hypothetical protein
MIPLPLFLESFSRAKSKTNTTTDINTIKDFLVSKFKDASQIFSKFDSLALSDFSQVTSLNEYTDKDLVFSKDEACSNYFFVLYGDINFYEEQEISDKNKLIKTVSAPTVYGHKIKEKFRFYGRARGKLTLLMTPKEKLDTLITDINARKSKFKLNFIKKFFPHMRLYTDDVLENLLPFFIRVEYDQNTKIFIDNEYDEFVYVIIQGEVAVAKKPGKLEISRNNETNRDQESYVVLETFSKGDVFGGYSALKNNKCNYTALTISKVTEVYKISKSHLLFYFGGKNGFIPKSIKAIDTLQQTSHNMKISYIKNINASMKDENDDSINKYFWNCNGKALLPKAGREINETALNNSLKEAWKTLENLDSKLSEFKNALLNGKTKPGNVDIFSKLKATNESRDYTKISGDATNRIASRKLNFGLNDNQMKSINKLGMICGVKKDKDEHDLQKLAEISNKMEGKRTNKLTGFDENLKDTEKQKVTQNVSNINTNNNNSTSNVSTGPSVDKPAVPAEIKPKKRNKVSLRNLLE